MIKTACHVHSDWSYDGKWSLQNLATAFRDRRYRVVMMTEHDRGFTEPRFLEYRAACASASSEYVLLVPGIEYSDATNTVHILVWGPVPFLGVGLPTAELLKQVKANNGVAIFAHPSRRHAWRLFEAAWADLFLGIEVWNRKTDGWAPSPDGMPLLQRTKCVPFVGMDFHDRNQFFPLAMELELGSQPEEESVLECLRSHRCHATAFGRPFQVARSSLFSHLLNASERCRRSLAYLYRWSRKRSGRRIANSSELKHTVISTSASTRVSDGISPVKSHRLD